VGSPWPPQSPITASAIFRHDLVTPRRYNGYEVDLVTLLDITEILGEADGSAAWLVGIAATSAWVAAHAPTQALDEIFGADPDARLAGGGAGAGTGRPVDGGVIVTGRWSYASGSLHASWAEVLTTLGTEGEKPTGIAVCLMPIDDLQVEDTWHTAGLPGTGSNTLIATDVFVPEYRIIPLSSLTEESSSSLGPLYRLPFRSIGALPVLGPLLGNQRWFLLCECGVRRVSGEMRDAHAGSL
jgi:alkylation response protein AidB-like acyl-CoA dehydrogenase